LKWHIDAAFAILTMGEGAITSISGKQKVNTRSSTALELVAVDDLIGSVFKQISRRSRIWRYRKCNTPRQ
jgi:hypothetical protein